jgi:nucleobase:cation symporter-1, NCS1 family
MKIKQVWQIETYGAEPVANKDRYSKPVDLFWIWFAANIGILGILYGGIIVSFRLSFLQSVLAACVGALSFVIVGILSVAGRDEGAPMLILSRAVFGIRGNLAPALVSWINLLGWESVTVVTGALSLEALLEIIFHGASGGVLTVASILLFAGMVISFGLFGHATLVAVQKFATWTFGLLTLVVVFYLSVHTHWHATVSMPSGSWTSGFLPAVSIIIAGTGVSWGNVAADYSRYLPRTASTKSIIGMVTFGGAIPLFILMMVGVLLIGSVPAIAQAANPIAGIGSELPHWMLLPYLFAATGGLIAEADLSLYSSGLNLLAIGVRVARYKTVVIDAVVMFLVSVYVLFVSQNFLGNLESFLTLVGTGLAAWESLFIVNRLLGKAVRSQLLEKRMYHVCALVCWLAGFVLGLLFTDTALFHGPFAKGIFAQSSLGVLLSFLASGILYLVAVQGIYRMAAAKK